MGGEKDVETLSELFSRLEDPRVERTREYSLAEILFLVLAAVVSGMNHLTHVEDFGKLKLEWLRTILPYENGVPSHDTIGRVLGKLDPDALQAVFLEWMNGVASRLDGVVAVDGKTLRGAIRRGEKRAFVHMVSAFGSANGLVYGAVKTAEKSNEIEAIPRLLELLHLKGAIVTIDAMGCQAEIMNKIIDRGGDFVIAVKQNQPTLGDDIDIAFHDVDIRGGEGYASTAEIEQPAHGRGEWRRAETLAADGHIQHVEKWPHIKTIIRITAERRVNGQVTQETRLFASSIAELPADRAIELVRAHWGIENRLHWVLDVAFQEDAARVWAANAAENLVVVRHLALNMLRSNHGIPGGIARLRNKAGLSDEVRMKVLSAAPS